MSISDLNEKDHEALLDIFEMHGINLNDREDIDKGDLARTISDDINRDISNQINDVWDQKSVDLEIDLIDDTIITNLRDTSVRREKHSPSADRVVQDVNRPSGPLSERSRGYKWFIAFYLNYISDVANKASDKLLLFDDPAVYLHPRGKRDWLSAVENVASETQVMYTSHSPFLINKNHPERLRMVEDIGEENGNYGTQVTNDFSASSQGSLEPVRKSLGIRLGDSPFVSNRNVFVEGLSEYHVIFGFSHYLKHKKNEDDILDISEVSLISVDGAIKMSMFGKWAESKGFAYALLLEDDPEGRDVKETISEKHTEIEPDRIVLLNKNGSSETSYIEIEDMFSPNTYISCLNNVYESKFGNFDEIEVDKHGGTWKINEQEYDGKGIVEIVEDEICNQDDIPIGYLMKKDVAEELKHYLMSEPDIPDETENRFKNLLGVLRATTGS